MGYRPYYLVLEVRSWSRHLKVFSHSTWHSFQRADSNPNREQGRERNEKRLVLLPQYEIDPVNLRVLDQSLGFLAYCSSTVDQHLDYYKIQEGQ